LPRCGIAKNGGDELGMAYYRPLLWTFCLTRLIGF